MDCPPAGFNLTSGAGVLYHLDQQIGGGLPWLRWMDDRFQDFALSNQLAISHIFIPLLTRYCPLNL
jgi:hypothetical protein